MILPDRAQLAQLFLCIRWVLRRRRSGFMFKQQLHTKTCHQCKFVWTLRSNTRCTSFSRGTPLPIPRKTWPTCWTGSSATSQPELVSAFLSSTAQLHRPCWVDWTRCKLSIKVGSCSGTSLITSKVSFKLWSTGTAVFRRNTIAFRFWSTGEMWKVGTSAMCSSIRLLDHQLLPTRTMFRHELIEGIGVTLLCFHQNTNLFVDFGRAPPLMLWYEAWFCHLLLFLALRIVLQTGKTLSRTCSSLGWSIPKSGPWPGQRSLISAPATRQSCRNTQNSHDLQSRISRILSEVCSCGAILNSSATSCGKGTSTICSPNRCCTRSCGTNPVTSSIYSRNWGTSTICSTLRCCTRSSGTNLRFGLSCAPPTQAESPQRSPASSAAQGHKEFLRQPQEFSTPSPTSPLGLPYCAGTDTVDASSIVTTTRHPGDWHNGGQDKAVVPW